MKILVNSSSYIAGMSNLIPRRTGLKTQLWIDHNGVSRKVAHSNVPRLKVGPVNNEIPVLIDKNPKVLVNEKSIKPKLLSEVKSTFPYISRNEDIFKKFYFDTTDEFDEEDLRNELKLRGDWK